MREVLEAALPEQPRLALNCEALHWGRHAPLETTRAALAPAGVSAAAALVPALRPAAAALDAGAQLMAPGHVRYPARGVGRILAGAGHDRESAGVWRMTLAADVDGAVAIYAWPFVVELDQNAGAGWPVGAGARLPGATQAGKPETA